MGRQKVARLVMQACVGAALQVILMVFSRLRFEELFRVAGSERLKRADERMNQAVYRASEAAEPAHAEEGENMEDTSASADRT